MVCGGDNFYCLIFIYWFEREREEWRWGGRQEERQRDSNLLFHLFIHSIGWFLYVPWMGITSAALLYRDDTLTHWATWPGWYHILNLVGLVAERRIHLLQGLSIKIDFLRLKIANPYLGHMVKIWVNTKLSPLFVLFNKDKDLVCHL